MAHLQNGAQVIHLVNQHPALKMLTASTTAGVLGALWFNGNLPYTGHGRRLTEAEAYAPPPYSSPMALPAPNIPFVEIFGHPRTISFSAAPPAAVSLRHVDLVSDSKPVPMATEYIADPYNKVAYIVAVLGSLLGLISFGTAVSVNSELRKMNNKKLSVDDPIAYLQSELTKRNAQIDGLQESLDTKQKALLDAQNDCQNANNDIT